MENRRPTSNFSKAKNSERYSKPSDNTKPDFHNNRQFVREFLKKEDKFSTANNQPNGGAKKIYLKIQSFINTKRFSQKATFLRAGKSGNH
jgi:hypothetical protein